MRSRAWISALLVAIGGASAGAQPVEMRAPIELGHVGVSVAIPRGFVRRPLRDPLEVLRAAKVRDGNTVASLGLSVFPVDGKVSAAAMAGAMLAELKRRKDVRKFRVLGSAGLKIAELPAAGRRVSYTFGSVGKVQSVRATFVREIPPAGAAEARGLCYSLWMEAVAEQQGQLQGAFTELARSVKLVDLQRPSPRTMGVAGEWLGYDRDAFRMHVPSAWYAVRTAGQGRRVAVWRGQVLLVGAPLEMAQTDFVAGGRTGPRAAVVVGGIPEGVTAKVFARRAVGAAGYRTGETAVFSEGAAALGGVAGHQVILEVRDLPAGVDRAGPPPEGGKTFLVSRAICLAPTAAGDRGRAYAVVLRCRAPGRELAAAWMDRLAAGFGGPWAIPRPATQPASAPAK